MRFELLLLRLMLLLVALALSLVAHQLWLTALAAESHPRQHATTRRPAPSCQCREEEKLYYSNG